MKKFITIITLLVLACAFVFAGGDEEKSSTPAASSEKITLTVWASAKLADRWEQLAENPYHRLRVQPLSPYLS